MTKNYLTPNQQKTLRNSPYVKVVSEIAVIYTDEFKRLFIAESAASKMEFK